jgi:hypothetical protein
VFDLAVLSHLPAGPFSGGLRFLGTALTGTRVGCGRGSDVEKTASEPTAAGAMPLQSGPRSTVAGRCQDAAAAFEHLRVSVSAIPGNRSRAAASTSRIEQAVSSDDTPSREQRATAIALQDVAVSAVDNIPGVDFASITVRSDDHTLQTVAFTDSLAEQTDAIQYELREGPCYAAVTDERFVLVNDMTATNAFPHYAPRAVDLGVGAQAAVQLLNDGQRAGLNLYSRKAGAFDRSTVQFAELFATQTAALLGYAQQVEQLDEALHTRTDIGTAVGIVMERYTLDRERAFAFLVRNSSHRNVKIRALALDIIDGTFKTTTREDLRSQGWP